MNRETLLKVIAGSAFVLLILDAAVLGPLLKKWDANAKQIGFLTEDVTKGRALLKRERTLQDRWDDMQKFALPADRSESESEVLTRLFKWSRDARLEISQINPTWRDEEDHAKFLCRIEGNGDMESVMRFLYDYDGDELGLRVENIEIVSRDKNGSRLGVDLTLSGLEIPQPQQQR
ncbi:MAG: hypothetical protein ACKVHO_16510 [Verrucomicrobiia bacterium]|jgi:hypothetical protein